MSVTLYAIQSPLLTARRAATTRWFARVRVSAYTDAHAQVSPEQHALEFTRNYKTTATTYSSRALGSDDATPSDTGDAHSATTMTGAA